jgi:hypothetical protein
MRGESQPGARTGLSGKDTRRSGSELERRYPVALGLYLVLAALVWFTVGEGKVLVVGKPVELRWVPLLIIGGLALRTVLARHADRIRRDGDEGGSLGPKG